MISLVADALENGLSISSKVLEFEDNFVEDMCMSNDLFLESRLKLIIN